MQIVIIYLKHFQKQDHLKKFTINFVDNFSLPIAENARSAIRYSSPPNRYDINISTVLTWITAICWFSSTVVRSFCRLLYSCEVETHEPYYKTRKKCWNASDFIPYILFWSARWPFHNGLLIFDSYIIYSPEQ